MMLAFLEGYDLLIVLGIIALLFGSSQLPKLARSLGSASSEFKKGAEEGGGKSKDDLKQGAAKASADIREAVAEPVAAAQPQPVAAAAQPQPVAAAAQPQPVAAAAQPQPVVSPPTEA